MENLSSILTISQAVLSVLFIITVLSQEKGSSLSLTFGGEGNGTFYGSKQGVEKILAVSSYIFGAAFVLNALAFIIIL